MPVYTYTGDEGRYYTTLGLLPEPGGEYELERNPGDGRWAPDDPEPVADGPAEEPAAPAPKTRKSAPAPVPDTTAAEPVPGPALTEGGA